MSVHPCNVLVEACFIPRCLPASGAWLRRTSRHSEALQLSRHPSIGEACGDRWENSNSWKNNHEWETELAMAHLREIFIYYSPLVFIKVGGMVSLFCCQSELPAR